MKYNYDSVVMDHKKDFYLMNKKLGIVVVPKGYIYHYTDDTKTMMTVPQDLHEATKHDSRGQVISKEKNGIQN